MAHTNTQATDYPYPNTNTPPLTAHHALIVCGALRRVCPCDGDRDAKEDDCDGVSTSDQFSWKQLQNATILVQKPSTNVLDELYLPCVGRMLEARWVRKSRRGLPFTHDGVGFHQREVVIYLLFLSFNATEGRNGLIFGYLLLNFRRWYGSPLISEP